MAENRQCGHPGHSPDKKKHLIGDYRKSTVTVCPESVSETTVPEMDANTYHELRRVC
jgi:hypothetical protein